MRWMRCLLLSVLVSLITASACKDPQTDQADKSERERSGNAKSPVGTNGTIYGRVVYEGNPPSQQKLMVVKDVAVCGKSDHYDERLVVGTDHGIQNAVISLIGVKNGKPLNTMGTEFILDQTGCSYRPHVMLAPVNTPIHILNNDGIRHNIHTYSTKNQPRNISHPKSKKKITMRFTAPEPIQVRCDIHGWMDCWIVVVDNPYHAVTDADGRFIITDIPPGDYTITCWQEKLGRQTTQVTVVADAGVMLDFKYSAKEKS